MQNCEQTIIHELVHDYDIRNGRAAAHEQSDVWVSKNALHHNFVLYFRQKLIGDVGVKNFLDSHWSSIELALMNHRESTLTDLLANLDVRHSDLSHACYGRQPT
jgi:hypothetical protein